MHCLLFAESDAQSAVDEGRQVDPVRFVDHCRTNSSSVRPVPSSVSTQSASLSSVAWAAASAASAASAATRARLAVSAWFGVSRGL